MSLSYNCLQKLKALASESNVQSRHSAYLRIGNKVISSANNDCNRSFYGGKHSCAVHAEANCIISSCKTVKWVGNKWCVLWGIPKEKI